MKSALFIEHKIPLKFLGEMVFEILPISTVSLFWLVFEKLRPVLDETSTGCNKKLRICSDKYTKMPPF